MTTSPDPTIAPAVSAGADEVAWWRRAVVYQVYVRSFRDGNGDGIGDLQGLIDRLPYIVELGVDAIWCNPWYPSPLLDGGYDVADHRAIDPRLGTLDDARELVARAHELGLRVIADLVPNHVSWEHPWFVAARSAAPGSAERERFVIRDGRGPDGALPPNNWESVFGGSAWTRLDDGQWYLHLFDRSQPDVNWENPEVAAEYLDILRFWLDLGIDGFRVDVASSLCKAPGLPDVEPPFVVGGEAGPGNHPHWDRDEVHDIIRTWRALFDRYDDRMMVAEAWVAPDRLPLYLRPDEYHQSFNFTFLRDSWRGHLHNRRVPTLTAAAAALGSTVTWAWGNHDVFRPVTRFGLPEQGDDAARAWHVTSDMSLLDEELGRRRARAAALLQLALPGSAYVYMGEELGLPEVLDIPDDRREDPVFFRSDDPGRDGCRVPLPWSADEPNYGFGGGAPWLPQPASFRSLAVDQQVDDPDSFLTLYRRALALRRELGTADEEIEMLDLGRDVVAFRRGTGLTCVVNMGTQPVALPPGEVLLHSRPDGAEGVLDPDDGVWLR